MRHWFFSSESVTEGHPDKVADAISDSVLDAVLEADRMGRVACEALVTTGLAVVAGEITTEAAIDIEAVTRAAVAAAGYNGFDPQFTASTLAVQVAVHRQSLDISAGVATSLEARNGSLDPLDAMGAGDQGIMFGFAVDETPELMPLPIQLAHRLAERLAEVRRNGRLPYLRPDGKTQVTIEYEGHRPVAVSRLLISAHHDPAVSIYPTMADDLWDHIVVPVVPESLRPTKSALYVNPSGRFELGGPPADTGLTGRKIVVDTYGGYARHGGGCFSGKDPTKVDRSGSYAARHAAKNVVAAGLASKCELQLAYAIGRAAPFSVHLDTFGTERVDPDRLSKLVEEFFDFRPAAIIDRLGLRKPVYRPTATYGHFGRSGPGFTWESTDLADELGRAAEAF